MKKLQELKEKAVQLAAECAELAQMLKKYYEEEEEGETADAQ